MAKAVFLANGGTGRLVIRTIRTHLVFFHEAGFEFRTERRRGARWVESEEALQPHDLACTFNGDVDAETFGATPQSRAGFFKLTSEVLSLRRYCVWVAAGNPEADPVPAPSTGGDARAVTEVRVTFTYNGHRHTLRH